MKEMEELFRLDLNSIEFKLIKEAIDEKRILAIDEKNAESLLKKIKSPKVIKKSENKTKASLIATKKRSENAQKKIHDAILELKKENKKINYNSVGVKSGVSFATIKKYLDV